MKYRENAQDTWHELTIKALDSMEIGSIIAFAGDTIPTGWLVCDGSSITQSAYPELYALIGGTLPDFKGRTLVGKDSNDTDFDTLLDTGGSKELQEHSHQIFVDQDGTGGIWGPNGTSQQSTQRWTSTGTAGTGNSGNLQPYAVINWIIKATNTTPTMASVVNAHNTSTTDAYSCDYINEINTYSTDEMVVGTWFGKPLYRMIVYGTIAGTGYWEDINMNLPSNIVIRKMDGIMDGYLAIPCNLNGTNRVNLQYQGSSNHIQVLMGGYSNATCVVVVEYTKTTD